MNPHRKLAAILFADIVGYTRQVSDDEVNAWSGAESSRNLPAPWQRPTQDGSSR